MTNQEIQDRIDKKKVQIDKIEKRIAKWQERATEEGFVKMYAVWYSNDPKKIKTLDDMIAARKEFDPEDAEEYVKNAYESHLVDCDRELKYANYDLEEAKKTLAKYEAQLAKNNEKAAIKKIPAIVEFLENWKQEVIEWVKTEGVASVNAYYQANSEAAKAFNSRQPKEVVAELERKERLAHQNMDQLTYSVYRPSRGIDEVQLNKILDKDVENKYFNLVSRIEEKAGNIIDASRLSVGAKGDLNGYITGDKGKVWVETIPAAGYNIQRFHYRTLVKPVRA